MFVSTCNRREYYSNYMGFCKCLLCHAINRNSLFTLHFYLTEAVDQDVTEARVYGIKSQAKAKAGKFGKRRDVCRDFP